MISLNDNEEINCNLTTLSSLKVFFTFVYIFIEINWATPRKSSLEVPLALKFCPLFKHYLPKNPGGGGLLSSLQTVSK